MLEPRIGVLLVVISCVKCVTCDDEETTTTLPVTSQTTLPVTSSDLIEEDRSIKSGTCETP